MDYLGFIANIEWISAICLIFGLLLVIFEMFIPGFGAPGTLGVILLIIGVIRTATSTEQVLTMVAMIIAVLGLALFIVVRSASKGRLARTLILADSNQKGPSNVSTPELAGLVGKVGISRTVLRPAGTADFEGIKVDVVTEAEFIPKDTKVKVLKVEGNRVVVRAAE